MKTIKIKGYEICIHKAYYSNNSNLYLGLIIASGDEEGSLYSDLTINLKDLSPCQGAVDIVNCEYADLIIKKYKWGTPTGEVIEKGIHKYPVFNFDMGIIEEYLVDII